MNDQSLEPVPQNPLSRTQIAIRLLYTVVFVIIFGILKFLIIATTVFQFAMLFITLKHSEPVRTFANRVISYAFRVWRYITLNSSQRPFPFAAEFPADLEPPEAEIKFD